MGMLESCRCGWGINRLGFQKILHSDMPGQLIGGCLLCRWGHVRKHVLDSPHPKSQVCVIVLQEREHRC